jgi:nucleoside 2-deoxyribosyltransferase
MKVYFSASILGKNRNEKAEKWQNHIIQAIKNSGAEIFDINFKVKPKQLYQETEEQYVNVFKRNTEFIKNADLVVAEVSLTDSGVGYEISYALNLKKPVLALYNEDSIEPTAPPIAVGKNKLLTFKKYKESDVEKIIARYMQDVRKQMDTKFILIISPEIDRYLEWASEFRRMHKAQVVRESVEAVMKKDKEYKAYLNSQ